MTLIREEHPADIGMIRLINEEAFGQPQEARLVELLRHQCEGFYSLVAEQAGRVTGHLLFTPVILKTGRLDLYGMGLGPMAVAEAFQKQGIGSAMIAHGLRTLQDQGQPWVIVLGHPSYYPRFGFVRASTFGIACQWEGVPDEAFMIRVFDPESIPVSPGTAFYHPAFDTAM